jgi:uncharacterized protein (DUF58 family)
VTRRGQLILALGVVLYGVAWLLGARTLYPVAVGLAAAPLGAALWVRASQRPLELLRRTGEERHHEGDDVQIELVARMSRGLRPPALVVAQRLGRLGEHLVPLRRPRGLLTLHGVRRGRYAFEAVLATVEDPFALACRKTELPGAGALLVYPRLVELDGLFTETGRTGPGGRRLLLRRPSGFDLHGVREHQQGESLRRVHWPSTAKRGQLMVKDLEDAPRDELAVVLDAPAGAAARSSFDLQVRAAGSLLRAYAAGGRHVLLAVNSSRPEYHRVRSERDWEAAYDALAAAEPDGSTPLAALLVSDAAPLARVAELVVVASVLTRPVAEDLARRAAGGRHAALVYVDAGSFAGRSAVPAAELLRLTSAGVAVVVIGKGDDLAAALRRRPSAVAAHA